MVIIATDSAADFELRELREMKITCLPMSVSFGSRVYLENIDLTKEEFFEKIETDPDFPRTSQPSPAMFEELFEQAGDRGDEIVYIPLSSGISGDYQTAVSVRDMVGYEKVYVIDSLTCTGGQRLLVEEAVRMRDAGADGKTIAQEMERLARKTVIYTVMDTLKYLYRNGRLSNTSYYIANLGRIKPIMHCSYDLSGGKAIIVAKPFGMARAMRYVTDRLRQDPPDPKHPVYVMYSCERENALKLAEKIQQIPGIEIEERQIVPVGAVVGAHVGRNACAIAYIRA